MEIINVLKQSPVTINTIIGYLNSDQKDISTYITEYGTGWTCIDMAKSINYLFVATKEGSSLLHIKYQNDSWYHEVSIIKLENTYLLEMWNGDFKVHQLENYQSFLSVYDLNTEVGVMHQVGTINSYGIDNILTVNQKLDRILDLKQKLSTEFKETVNKMLPELTIYEKNGFIKK